MTKRRLTIELDDNPKWWVNSLYTIHATMKSNTGIFMLIDKGATYTESCKQKLSWTKEAMGQVLWTRHFLSARTTITYNHHKPWQQEYNPTGRKWCNLMLKEEKTSKRMISLYNWQNKKGEAKEAFCPTTTMLADFFTKPLQGYVFKKCEIPYLTLPNTEKIDDVHRSVLEKNTNLVRTGTKK